MRLLHFRLHPLLIQETVSVAGLVHNILTAKQHLRTVSQGLRNIDQARVAARSRYASQCALLDALSGVLESYSRDIERSINPNTSGAISEIIGNINREAERCEETVAQLLTAANSSNSDPDELESLRMESLNYISVLQGLQSSFNACVAHDPDQLNAITDMINPQPNQHGSASAT